ncbi:MAG: VCBS repeat-containing protein, partial [Elusimicrobia bacterium]|nr:VCBS repeat-containing protein [Elusimicrobiota bacterium]
MAWGDFDMDGDIDVLGAGYKVSGTRELLVYKNNGNGSFDAGPIYVCAAGGGVFSGGVAWGDFDKDGDLDIVASGKDSANDLQLRAYSNNGNGTFDQGEKDLDGRGGGLITGGVAPGDFDNDGDLDVLANGGSYNSDSDELRVYKNNGNGVFDDNQIDVDGPDGGNSNGDVAWGDFDKDGDLDILTTGSFSSTYRLSVYKNNGNASFDPAQIEVDTSGQGLTSGGVEWGDFDNDADLDVLAVGNVGSYPELRVYLNNGNGSFDANQIEVESLNNGLQSGSVAWGDYDNDGDLDILANGYKTKAQLRVYINNGNGTFNPEQSELDGLDGGLRGGTSVWGDFDNDGDIDVLASGYNVTSVYRLSVYSNQYATPNTAPSSPGSLSATWSSDGIGSSTATFTWSPASDSGTGATPVDGLSYSINVATTNNFLGQQFVSDRWASPGMGNYLKPPKIFNGNSNHGVMFRSGLASNTSYYFRLKTIDAGLKESSWSSTAMLFTAVASSLPYAVTDLVANISDVSGLPYLTWTCPLNINSGVNPAYDIRYSTAGPITNDTEFINATALTGEPVPINSGVTEGMGVNGLTPYLTYYFALKTYNSNGISPLDLSAPRPMVFMPGFFELNVGGVNGGLASADVDWGDFDGDGDLDILVCGYFVYEMDDATELCVYSNNGNGTFNFNEILVNGLYGGLSGGSVGWGDFDNDGDLDILASGSYSGRHLRVHKNNGNSTFEAPALFIDGPSNGTGEGAAWGDYDNDGDLDVLATGNNQLRVYKNNGNASFDYNQIEIDGVNNGFTESCLAWGDFDADGDMDILVGGRDSSSARQLRIYNNNGNGTIDPSEIDVDGPGGGLRSGGLAWGDFENDGDLDILVNGFDASSYRNRIYLNNGNGTMDGGQIEVDQTCGSILIWIQKFNTVPAAPVALASGFSFSETNVSVASFTWSAGSDSGTGATPENGLNYDIQISTTADFSKLMFPGQMGAKPRMGSYQRPPKIFNGSTYHGVVLKSMDPWNPQTTASYGIRADTTYYYRVKTVDSGLAESPWSNAGSLLAAAPPSISTLAVTGGAGEATLSWYSAGDDGGYGNLTGAYRIQYASYTASWSTNSTPTNATTITLSTTNVTVGSARNSVVTGLSVSNTYYFVLWTQDDVNTWSTVSNTTSTWVVGAGGDSISPSTSTLSVVPGATEGKINIS